jgi:hypothetical protein
MKNLLNNLYNKNIMNKTIGKTICNKANKNFSTLIIPEISNGKIHSSIFNLTKAASELDNDVKIKIVKIILNYFSLFLSNIKRFIFYFKEIK